MKHFNHVHDIDDLQVPTRQSIDGKRVYVTPDGNQYPSITTILGKQPKPSLVEWRERVGDEEANRIMKEAAKIGTEVHELCERYLYNKTIISTDSESRRIFNRMRFILGNIDNIVGLEIPVYSDKLRVAGTTDCVAEYNGKISVIDFKTSCKPKREEWIEDYWIQAAFYAAAFYEMTGCISEQLVIIIAVRNSFDVQVFKKSIFDSDIYIDKLVDIMKKDPQVIQIK